MNETVCRVWLSLALRPGSAGAKLFDKFDSAEDVWHASADELKEAGAKDGLISRLSDRDLSKAARIAEFADRYRVSLITVKDPAYPDLLREIPDPPFLLYVLGRLPDFEKTLSVGVVGTRDMTEYGFETAYRVSYRLASAGVAVVSGMARGVDGAAAAGALAAGGVTIAVLGCGLDSVYPPEHRPLMARIAAEGAAVSEFPPGSPPAASHFPVRNRIISGLSRGVYVVEAGRSSGAVLTAGEATRQGREVFALPGRSTDPQSEGTNRLLRDGARAATDACDILDFYRERFPDAVDGDGYARSVCGCEPDRGFVSSLGVALPGERRTLRAKATVTASETAPPPREAAAPSAKVPEDARLREFFELIEPGTPVCADCFAASGYTPPEAMNLLSLLEISGYVKSIPGGMYIKY